MTTHRHIKPNDRVVVPLLGAPSVCRVIAVFDDGKLRLLDEQSKRLFNVDKTDVEYLDNTMVHVTNYADALRSRGIPVRHGSGKVQTPEDTLATLAEMVDAFLNAKSKAKLTRLMRQMVDRFGRADVIEMIQVTLSLDEEEKKNAGEDTGEKETPAS